MTPVFYELLDRWTSFLRRKGVRFSVESSAAVPRVPPPHEPAPAAAKEPTGRLI